MAMTKGMKIKDIGPAKKYPIVFEEPKGADMNGLQRNRNSYKTTATGAENDGGTTDVNLAERAASIYKKAVDNSDRGGLGDPGLLVR